MIWSAILPPNVHQPSLIARYLMSSSPNNNGSSMSIEERCQLITRVYNDSNKASVGIAIARRGLAGHDIRSLFIRERPQYRYIRSHERSSYLVCYHCIDPSSVARYPRRLLSLLHFLFLICTMANNDGNCLKGHIYRAVWCTTIKKIAESINTWSL
jgi:hypothetical protein